MLHISLLNHTVLYLAELEIQEMSINWGTAEEAVAYYVVRNEEQERLKNKQKRHKMMQSEVSKMKAYGTKITNSNNENFSR